MGKETVGYTVLALVLILLAIFAAFTITFSLSYKITDNPDYLYYVYINQDKKEVTEYYADDILETYVSGDGIIFIKRYKFIMKDGSIFYSNNIKGNIVK